MPVSDSSESLVYGFGNEIIITFSIFIVLLPLLVYYLFENYRSSSQNGRQGQQSENELYSNGQQEVPQIYNNGQQCVICLNEQRLAVETSCGHVYCGLCLRQLYDHLNYRLLLCPICRQPVTIIFIYFTDSEREAGSDDDIAESRSDVYSFVTHYNGRFSNRPRSIMDHITDLPILLRHLWNDFFTFGGLIRIRLRIRIMICILSAIMYVFVPQDIVPETMFGILGLIDDVLILGFVVVYLATIYRNAVANGNFAGLRNFGVFN